MNRLAAILIGGLLILLGACGGSGNSDTSATARTGTVALTFTDAPSDEFQHINLEVSGINLIGDSQQVTLFDATVDGGNRVIDLLALEAFSEYFTVEENVPVGAYNKIRLFVESIDLVKKDGNGDITETINADLPANGKIDLNPRGSFVVQPGATLQVQIDIDANKSIKIHQAGNSERYKFRPVVFIDIIDNNNRGRLVRIHGTVESIDTLDNNFVLCPDHAYEDNGENTETNVDLSEHCIRVNPANASIFDITGLPVESLDLGVDEELTAIGFLVHEEGLTNEADSPDMENDDVYRHRSMNAEVIELGPAGNFEILKGKIASEPVSDNDQFSLNLATTSASEINIQLQSGTKIFDKEGVALDYTDLQLDRYAMIDGVFDTTMEGLYNAALIIIDSNEVSADETEKVSGEVLTVDTDNSIIMISTETGDLGILVEDQLTQILLIDDDAVDDSSLSESIDALLIQPGQLIEAYGELSQDGYFHAMVILVSDSNND